MIDLGASFHVTSHGDFFTCYSRGDFGNVKIGNNGAFKIMSIRDIFLETNVKRTFILKTCARYLS